MRGAASQGAGVDRPATCRHAPPLWPLVAPACGLPAIPDRSAGEGWRPHTLAVAVLDDSTHTDVPGAPEGPLPRGRGTVPCPCSVSLRGHPQTAPRHHVLRPAACDPRPGTCDRGGGRGGGLTPVTLRTATAREQAPSSWTYRVSEIDRYGLRPVGPLPRGRGPAPLLARSPTAARDPRPAACCGLLRPAAACCDLRPAACGLRPVACGLRPAACDLRPATCGLRPAACDLRPATCGLRPATCGLRPATCGLRAATRDPRPATCNLRPATRDLRPAACDLRPATCGPPPATRVLRPASCGRRPVIRHLRPATRVLRPATCGLRPAARVLRPAACDLRPATCDPPPAACDPRPATRVLRPATCGLRPAARHLRPASCDLRRRSR